MSQQVSAKGSSQYFGITPVYMCRAQCCNLVSDLPSGYRVNSFIVEAALLGYSARLSCHGPISYLCV